ncbi:MAG: NfeD family protein [Ramlibacter sp.]
MADSTIWWLLAGAAVAVELLTGTFYLLMIAIGLAAGALAAHAGASPTVQLLVSAAVCGGAVTTWHMLRPKRPAVATGSNRDINLDVGETIDVPAWESDGTASVKYRGAQWTVVAAPGGNPQAGAHRVSEVVGSRLIVEKI